MNKSLGYFSEANVRKISIPKKRSGVKRYRLELNRNMEGIKKP